MNIAALFIKRPVMTTLVMLAILLFGVMACGDDHNVDETWIAGKRAYKKSAKGEAE